MQNLEEKRLTIKESWEWFWLLKKLNSKESKRNPMYEINTAAKFIALGVAAFFIFALVLYGYLLVPVIISESCPSMEPYHILDEGMVFILIADFNFRYIFQQTPTQQLKPFALLPISKTFLIKTFLVKDIFRWYNCLWLSFIAPFAVATIYKYYHFTGCLGYALGWWILLVFNSQLYLMFRTLSKHHIAWIAAPIAIFVAIISAVFEFDWFGRLLMDFGEGFILWNPLSFIAVIALVSLAFTLNTAVQYKFMTDELVGKEESQEKLNTTISKASSIQLSFLDRFGEYGEYIKLEFRSLMRNKPLYSHQISAIVSIVLFAIAVIADPYSDSFLTNFAGYGDFVIFGSFSLTNIMCVEGNYIDGLMVRKESLYKLLCAKYYFNCIITIIPALIMLIPLFMGCLSLLQYITYFITACGMSFPIYMFLAIVNKEKMPLSGELTSKPRFNNTVQIITSCIALFVPIILFNTFNLLLGHDLGYVLIVWISSISILFSSYWIKFIYVQFMKHRYENLEGFRNS